MPGRRRPTRRLRGASSGPTTFPRERARLRLPRLRRGRAARCRPLRRFNASRRDPCHRRRNRRSGRHRSPRRRLRRLGPTPRRRSRRQRQRSAPPPHRRAWRPPATAPRSRSRRRSWRRRRPQRAGGRRAGAANAQALRRPPLRVARRGGGPVVDRGPSPGAGTTAPQLRGDGAASRADAWLARRALVGPSWRRARGACRRRRA